MASIESQLEKSLTNTSLSPLKAEICARKSMLVQSEPGKSNKGNGTSGTPIKIILFEY